VLKKAPLNSCAQLTKVFSVLDHIRSWPGRDPETGKEAKRADIPAVKSGNCTPKSRVAAFPVLKKITGSLVKLPVMKIQVRL